MIIFDFYMSVDIVRVRAFENIFPYLKINLSNESIRVDSFYF